MYAVARWSGCRLGPDDEEGRDVEHQACVAEGDRVHQVCLLALAALDWAS
jgi:hypothetical protein